jgi:hypothetical protein
VTQQPPNPEPFSTESTADHGLQALAAALPELEYRHLRRYAEFTLAAQPDEARDALQTFIARASTWEVRKQRQAAVRIADVAEQIGSGPGSTVLPNRLWSAMVEPTLKQWAEEDDVALPHRLLALLDWPSYLHLRRAHELDPEDQAVARRLAATLIRDVHFSTSNLGKIDIAKLEEAEVLVAGLQDEKARQSLAVGLDDLRRQVSGPGTDQKPPNPPT